MRITKLSFYYHANTIISFYLSEFNVFLVNVDAQKLLEWHFYLKQMGVGGDNSWGARPHDEYMIYPGVYEFSFAIQPVQ